ncbi:unnamed protein product [Sphagnum jensenii]
MTGWEKVDEFVREWERRYPPQVNDEVRVYVDRVEKTLHYNLIEEKTAYLSWLEVSANLRRNGIANNRLRELCQLADQMKMDMWVRSVAKHWRSYKTAVVNNTMAYNATNEDYEFPTDPLDEPGYPPGSYNVTANLSGQLDTFQEVLLKGDGTYVSFEVSVTGDTLTSFIVQCQFYPNGPWHNYIGQSDFASTTEWAMVKASANNPATLSAGNTSFAIVRVEALYKIRFQAQGSGTGSIQIVWSKRPALLTPFILREGSWENLDRVLQDNQLQLIH